MKWTRPFKPFKKRRDSCSEIAWSKITVILTAHLAKRWIIGLLAAAYQKGSMFTSVYSWHPNTGLCRSGMLTTRKKLSPGGEVEVSDIKFLLLLSLAALLWPSSCKCPELAALKEKPAPGEVWSPSVALLVTTHWPPAPVELVLCFYAFDTAYISSSPQPRCASLHWPVKLPVGGKDGGAWAFFLNSTWDR